MSSWWIGSQLWTLERVADVTGDTPNVEQRFQAISRLESILGTIEPGVLAQLVHDLLPGTRVTDDREVIHIVMDALDRGVLHLQTDVSETRFRGQWHVPSLEAGSSPISENTTSEEVATTPTSWLEIQMRDEADRSVPGLRYVVELPDGTTRHGRLNRHGNALLREIPEGSCKVTFIDIDKDAWSKVSV